MGKGQPCLGGGGGLRVNVLIIILAGNFSQYSLPKRVGAPSQG